jgi:superfamily II DNA helicase RecQ
VWVHVSRSTVPVADRRKVLVDLHNKEPSVKLLYVTPELLSSDWFLSVLQTLFEHRRLSMFAVDEAHCISRSGQQDDYLICGVSCVCVTMKAVVVLLQLGS